MTDFRENVKSYNSAEEMADDYLRYYYSNREMVFPINPFEMLKIENIVFSLRNFKGLEGVYIPAENESDIAIVGININRPITRQRFTAAHELCHHFRDCDLNVACPIGQKNNVERFADSFAAAVLMPRAEMKKQIKKHSKNGYVSFDGVLEIANFFGVSFEACLNRLAYTFHVIDGDTSGYSLEHRKRQYRPDKKRIEAGYNYLKLYEDLIDSYEQQLAFTTNDHARYIFQNNYIYNDSRIEGVDVSIEQASEIVTDLRLNLQNSQYCSEDEKNEVYMSIAGHYVMYQEILKSPQKEKFSIFDIAGLNNKLFSHYPNPDYGGSFRSTNPLVLGAKFETIDYSEVIPELLNLENEWKDLFVRRSGMKISEYIEKVFKLHHQLTVIHPFQDGNGRTLRAFMNLQLVASHISPLYIKAENKKEYIDALSKADVEEDYTSLYEFLFKTLLESSAELAG